jgi:hypothetical protein
MNSERQLAKLVVAVAMFAFLAVPARSSHANTFALGALTPFADISISSPSHTTGSFSDVFSFSVTADAALASVLANISFFTSGGISNFTTSLYEIGSGGSVLKAIGATSIVPNGPVTVTTSIISFSPLLTGVGSPALPSYEIRTSGIVVGAFGSYGGNLVVSPIPEPEIYAMMVAGLGLLGFVARRRKQGVAV